MADDLSRRNAVILLVNSDADIRAILRDVLDRAGHLVLSCGDLGDAVDRLGEARPDLLIISPYINSMTGRTAADYLRAKQPGLPVLMVAGFIEDDRTETLKAVEYIHTFPKPFHANEFLAKVQDVLIHLKLKR